MHPLKALGCVYMSILSVFLQQCFLNLFPLTRGFLCVPSHQTKTKQDKNSSSWQQTGGRRLDQQNVPGRDLAADGERSKVWGSRWRLVLGGQEGHCGKCAWFPDCKRVQGIDLFFSGKYLRNEIKKNSIYSNFQEHKILGNKFHKRNEDIYSANYSHCRTKINKASDTWRLRYTPRGWKTILFSCQSSADSRVRVSQITIWIWGWVGKNWPKLTYKL